MDMGNSSYGSTSTLSGEQTAEYVHSLARAECATRGDMCGPCQTDTSWEQCFPKSQDVNRLEDTTENGKGHAKIGKLLANSTRPVGNLRAVLMISIMDIFRENVSMKAVLGHFGKPMQEAKDMGPPDTSCVSWPMENQAKVYLI